MENLIPIDPHAQLQSLYMSILKDQARFDEFRQLLAMYPPISKDAETEPEEASRVRKRLNARIREWTEKPSAGLSAMQMQLWRGIIVEQRINIALSPWKESNYY